MRQRRERNKKGRKQDFPSAPVVENSLCNAGDTGLIPGQGTTILHAAEQLSTHTTTRKSLHRKERSCTQQLMQPNKERRKECQLWGPLIVYIIQMSYLIRFLQATTWNKLKLLWIIMDLNVHPSDLYENTNTISLEFSLLISKVLNLNRQDHEQCREE